MPVDTDVNALRSNIESSLRDGDTGRAVAALDALWQGHPGPAAAAFVNARAGQFGQLRHHRQAKVAILRSFTVEPVVPLLRAGATVNHLDLDVTIGGFNTYAQEILDPSSDLYQSWDPDVVILAVQTRDLVPELWDGFSGLDPSGVAAVVARATGELAGLVGAFRERSSATLVVHQLELPPWPDGGVADRLSPDGQIAAIQAINREIAAIAAGQPSTYPLDYDALVAAAGRGAWFDEMRWRTARMPIRSDRLVDLAAEWLRYVQPAIGHVAKAIVVDLDNTLWGGVVGEDGVEGISLGTEDAGAPYGELQKVLRNLRRRGVLLAISSKNNEADARRVFDEHPAAVLGWDDFAATRANWDPKPDSLRSIAAQLNIGLDSLVFLDDNPAECELVRAQLPDVVVVDADHSGVSVADGIARSPFFQRLSLTVEDRERAQLYAAQQQRQDAERTSLSLDDFLHSLGLRMSIDAVAAADIARVAQLTQKTNQFNVTTRRYTEADIERMRGDGRHGVYVVRATDRFGDHGLIGVLVVERDATAWTIDTLLLSCRVIGRGIETAILAWLMSEASMAAVPELVGEFVPTAKNAPASSLFEAHGFVALADERPGQWWRRDVRTEPTRVPAWITIEQPAPRGAS